MSTPGDSSNQRFHSVASPARPVHQRPSGPLGYINSFRTPHSHLGTSPITISSSFGTGTANHIGSVVVPAPPPGSVDTSAGSFIIGSYIRKHPASNGVDFQDLAFKLGGVDNDDDNEHEHEHDNDNDADQPSQHDDDLDDDNHSDETVTEASHHVEPLSTPTIVLNRKDKSLATTEPALSPKRALSSESQSAKPAVRYAPATSVAAAAAAAAASTSQQPLPEAPSFAASMSTDSAAASGRDQDDERKPLLSRGLLGSGETQRSVRSFWCCCCCW
ncbi:uncharacterized protein BJ171DRAFT_164901 [Polychytrium aggregatum]|uniref:uncharacterized protein n=1 Tax=Polychytrium aggregatum TaxID=110093 RepID=UPI0022FEFD5C|nr:uncharacterized protein BJ171DRAFT_164901 [Polychytrium aggregatum]KAI9202636.1 hypothetical protein BJ171DRAFT_164901 [Polychytrium aggregatum]